MSTAAPADTPHTIEPELRGRTPRSVRYTPLAQLIRQVVFHVTFLLFATLVWIGNGRIQTAQALWDRGVPVKATVTGTEQRKAKNGATYYLYFKFTHAGRQVGGEYNIDKHDYLRIRRGYVLPVTCLPDNPEVYVVGEMTEEKLRDKRTLWYVWGTLAAIFLGGMAAGTEGYFRGRRTLLERGTAAVAEVADKTIEQVQTKNGQTPVYRVTYLFEGPHETPVRNAVGVSEAVYTRLDIGDRFTVLYGGDGAYSSVPYPALTAHVEVVGASRSGVAW